GVPIYTCPTADPCACRGLRLARSWFGGSPQRQAREASFRSSLTVLKRHTEKCRPADHGRPFALASPANIRCGGCQFQAVVAPHRPCPLVEVALPLVRFLSHLAAGCRAAERPKLCFECTSVFARAAPRCASP